MCLKSASASDKRWSFGVAVGGVPAERPKGLPIAAALLQHRQCCRNVNAKVITSVCFLTSPGNVCRDSAAGCILALQAPQIGPPHQYIAANNLRWNTHCSHSCHGSSPGTYDTYYTCHTGCWLWLALHHCSEPDTSTWLRLHRVQKEPGHHVMSA